MWYTNSYRRHLCDMHIDEWNDTFLSAFSPEEYFKNLEKAHIQNAMLYFQSHVGLCSPNLPGAVSVTPKNTVCSAPPEREFIISKTISPRKERSANEYSQTHRIRNTYVR